MTPQSNAPADAHEIQSPFTQSWIQSLTLAASNPVARTINPQLQLLDKLYRSGAEQERIEAARKLWEVAVEMGLDELLSIVPSNQSEWLFQEDDIFVYHRRESAAVPAAKESEVKNYETWAQAIGISPLSVQLTADVFSGDWASLVRSEAMRLSKSLNTNAVAKSSTINLPCVATWENEAWKVQFEQVDWIVVNYEDQAFVDRPQLSDIEEKLLFAASFAEEKLTANKRVDFALDKRQLPWHMSVDRLQPLHERLRSDASSYSPWFFKVWSTVWPIVYREQNVLSGKADINFLRNEIKNCLQSQPKLTVWMFLFAKIVCLTQTGSGLGLCADFRSS